MTYGEARAAEAEPSALAGRTFISTAVTERGTPRAMPAGTKVMLRFTDDGRLIADAGCNTLSGRAELSGGRLLVPQLATTLRGCEDELMAQDDWLASILKARPSWQLSGSRLRVSAGQTVIELIDG